MEKDTIGEPITLNISFAGINPVKYGEKLPHSTSSNRGNLVELVSREYLSKQSFNKGNLTLNITSDQTGMKSDIWNDPKGDGGMVKIASTTRVANGVKYYFVIRRVDNNQLVLNQEFIVGGPRSISLNTGTQYRWYAYSYLSEDPIPDPLDNVNNPDLDVYKAYTRSNKTFLYKSGQFVASGDTRQLDIVFDHKLTEINVEINVKKAYADITTIEGSLVNPSIIKTGIFNLETGLVENMVSYGGSGELEFVNKTVGDASVKTASLFTADSMITNYAVNISELSVTYPNNPIADDLLTDITAMPGGGTVNFGTFIQSNVGHVLQGKLNLTFMLPEMKIIAFSNDVNGGNYRLGALTAAGLFVRNHNWFGPGSDYVNIKDVVIDSHSDLTQLKASLATPANYPEILIIGNDNDYLDEVSWGYVMNYLNAGGIVYHAQDNDGGTHNRNFLRTLLGSDNISLNRPGESYGVYKFTNTLEAAADTLILKGVFGDVRPYHWGQDRAGTTYVRGYTGNDVIVYSNHAENKNPPSVPGMAFFRHKTKKYFYVGDGGFFANASPGLNGNSTTAWPFRSVDDVGALQDFPLNAFYGSRATSNAPTSGAAGSYEIANGKMFGNMLAWMLEQAYFDPVNKN